MGVKGLKTLLKTQCPESFFRIPREALQNKIIGIDAHNVILNATSSKRLQGKRKNTTHLYGLYDKVKSYQKTGMIPIFVFDGDSPFIKKRKKTIHVTDYWRHSVTRECKLLLNALGVRYIQAPEEADSQLAWMQRNKHIDFIISDDFDILVFGGDKLLPDFRARDRFHYYVDYNTIQKNLGLTHNDIKKIAVLLGNDYCSRAKNTNIHDVVEQARSRPLCAFTDKQLIAMKHYVLSSRDIVFVT